MKKSTAVIASVLTLLLPLLYTGPIHDLVVKYPLGAAAVTIITAIATLFHVPLPEQK